MTTVNLNAPPVLSTPAEHTFFEVPTPTNAILADTPHMTEKEARDVYEIVRTAAHIREKRWRRIALQFPDAMLPDAPWVVEALSRALAGSSPASDMIGRGEGVRDLMKKVTARNENKTDMMAKGTNREETPHKAQKQHLYILADTSYSSCCVDEIAAEHADADGIVHYGRACLSPTSRLPVLHIFTRQKLDYAAVAAAFENEFSQRDEKVIVMADVMFQEHVLPLCEFLEKKGYTNVLPTDILRDPGGTVPNRRITSLAAKKRYIDNGISPPDMKQYHAFHISSPPTSLLLILSSRLSSLRIYPTPSSPYTTTHTNIPDPSMTPSLLRRRYGLVIRLATASIIGILVNTLSVRNYMDKISTLRAEIAAAGKKSYTVVVGKLNAAKLANFSEVDGWVVVGCWESGLVEQDDLWKPVITPFELRLALQREATRVWTGDWWGGIEGVSPCYVAMGDGLHRHSTDGKGENGNLNPTIEDWSREEIEGGVSDEESEPPEFDLRTGKLISHSRPLHMAIRNGNYPNGEPSLQQQQQLGRDSPSSSLVRRTKEGELAAVNGVVSPGAEYLRSQRTWQGLGSDFRAVRDEADEDASTVVEEGHSGVARGYTVGRNENQVRI